MSILDWGYIEPDELFGVVGHGVIPTARCILPNEPFSSNRISETQIPKIKRLYEVLVKLNPKSREKLQIAIDSWIKSKAGDNPEDKIIDLGIAFEAFYLSEGTKDQLTLQFRLRAAWHLGEDKEQRKRLMKEFQAIYDWRSTVVHTGKLPNKTRRTPFTPEEVRAFIKKAQDLCRESILKILESGEFPDWNDLILG